MPYHEMPCNSLQPGKCPLVPPMRVPRPGDKYISFTKNALRESLPLFRYVRNEFLLFFCKIQILHGLVNIRIGATWTNTIYSNSFLAESCLLKEKMMNMKHQAVKSPFKNSLIILERNSVSKHRKNLTCMSFLYSNIILSQLEPLF